MHLATNSDFILFIPLPQCLELFHLLPCESIASAVQPPLSPETNLFRPIRRSDEPKLHNWKSYTTLPPRLETSMQPWSETNSNPVPPIGNWIWSHRLNRISILTRAVKLAVVCIAIRHLLHHNENPCLTHNQQEFHIHHLKNKNKNKSGPDLVSTWASGVEFSFWSEFVFGRHRVGSWGKGGWSASCKSAKWNNSRHWANLVFRIWNC